MNRGEIFAGLIDAHLDAQIGFEIDVPRARVTHDLAIPGSYKQRTLPERLRQRSEPERGVKVLAGLNHVERAHPPSLQDVGQRIAGVGVGGRLLRSGVIQGARGVPHHPRPGEHA